MNKPQLIVEKSLRIHVTMWIISAALLAIISCTPEGPLPITPSPSPTLPTKTTVDLGDLVMNTYSSPPPLLIDLSKSYSATFETSEGDIVVKLMAKEAPLTVNNFVFLARDQFYDNTTFHRVLPNFMAQGGDPTGTGRGGPGYQFEDEFHPDLRHNGEGVLSMANAGPNTNGSQFFITYVATPFLDDRHTVFGKVTEGMDVALNLTPRDPQRNPDFPGSVLKTVTIHENPS